jgi:hypothetical protein
MINMVLYGELASYPIRQTRTKIRKTSHFLNTPIKDVFLLHKNLISLTSLKVLAAAAPLYAITRSLDDCVHRCFYDEKNHKNINQMPKSCSKFAAKGMAIPIVLFGGFAFFSRDEQLKTTSYVFLLGMPFVIIGKDIIKHWQAEHCKRPRCEWFNKDKCHYGGFPSGHMAEAIYMTVLFGMRYGPQAWIPLSAWSAYVFGSFINCNRHFVSQLVAGGALGAMYALAANKLIDSKLIQNIDFSAGVSPRGEMHVGVGFKF